jgi:hypothetical protein
LVMAGGSAKSAPAKAGGPQKPKKQLKGGLF